MSVVLQAKFLERSGHTVTFVSPALRSGPLDDPRFIDLPSMKIPTVKEYTWMWPRRSQLKLIGARLASRPPVDVIHVQSDFWGAALGYRFAHASGIPLVHTFHNRLDVGVDGTVPFPRVLYAMLGVWQRWSLRERFTGLPRTAYEYFAGYAREADVVVSPSKHFSAVLSTHGVVARNNRAIEVMPTGVDDDVLSALVRRKGNSGRPRVVWVGRFSPEKRLLEFCEALSHIRGPLDPVIVGDGALRDAATAIAPPTTQFTGSLPYIDTLQTIADADVLVQSSSGFETQGMTVTEALAVGTPVVVVDPDIAGELPAGSVTVAADLTPESLATAISRAITNGSDRITARRGTRSEFLQSHLSDKMIALYQSLIVR